MEEQHQGKPLDREARDRGNGHRVHVQHWGCRALRAQVHDPGGTEILLVLAARGGVDRLGLADLLVRAAMDFTVRLCRRPNPFHAAHHVSVLAFSAKRDAPVGRSRPRAVQQCLCAPVAAPFPRAD